ncbi:MAG TPA: hypothetical protein VGP88_04705 [Thermoplasmata archaeon]|jgi:hypothetical protein|nr:hypothetical protein [Thermoplasmata archaeon]
MPGKRSKAARKLRGAQKWIVAELGELKPGTRLSTSEIAKRISKTRQKKFHKNSVYNALRLLVERGRIVMHRNGREKSYQLSGAAMPEPRSPDPVRPVSTEVAPPAIVTATSLPHKLGLGEILVLSVDGRDVVTATNLHGRLVFERHRAPG